MKSVRFADGIPPGEGTSPSGGEDLPSPPPPKRKLPKEERYKKTKIRSRKKVKVSTVRLIPTPEAPDLTYFMKEKMWSNKIWGLWDLTLLENL